MPIQHSMSSDAFPELGKVRFTCRQCEHCVEIDTSTGDTRVLHPGDRNVAHAGSTFDRLGADIDIALDVSNRPPHPPRLH